MKDQTEKGASFPYLCVCGERGGGGFSIKFNLNLLFLNKYYFVFRRAPLVSSRV